MEEPTTKKMGSQTKLSGMPLLITLFVLVWACLASGFAYLQWSESKIQRVQAEANKAESGRQMNRADLLTREIKDLKDKESQDLSKVFGNLHVFKPGRTDVKIGYFDNFDVTLHQISLESLKQDGTVVSTNLSTKVLGGVIKTTFINTSENKSQPNFTINFINKYGFVTASFHKKWIIDRVKLNESRMDTDPVVFEFGEPIYYTLKFD